MGGGNAQVRRLHASCCLLTRRVFTQKTAMSRARNQAKADQASGKSASRFLAAAHVLLTVSGTRQPAEAERSEHDHQGVQRRRLRRLTALLTVLRRTAVQNLFATLHLH